MLETDTLFGDELGVLGVTANWASRSWVINNMAELIPLLHIWNTQYAQHTTTPPPLESCDFARLYTNVQTSDMTFHIMELIIRVFALDHHLLHVGLKV